MVSQWKGELVTHLLPFEVGEGVGDEVEEDAALTDLLDQQLLPVPL